MAIDRKDPMIGSDNAYRPPAADLVFADRATPDAVAIREAHIGHERQLKSVGLLFGLGAVLLGFTGIATVIPALARDGGGTENVAMLVGGSVAFVAIAALLGALAYGYRSLSPWVKYVGTPVSVLGLLAIPVGTLIHGYILYLIWCEKGRRVLADDYAAIIRATPQVRYKRTVGDWIAVVLLVLLVAGFAAMLLFT